MTPHPWDAWCSEMNIRGPPLVGLSNICHTPPLQFRASKSPKNFQALGPWRDPLLGPQRHPIQLAPPSIQAHWTLSKLAVKKFHEVNSSNSSYKRQQWKHLKTSNHTRQHLLTKAKSIWGPVMVPVSRACRRSSKPAANSQDAPPTGVILQNQALELVLITLSMPTVSGLQQWRTGHKSAVLKVFYSPGAKYINTTQEPCTLGLC